MRGFIIAILVLLTHCSHQQEKSKPAPTTKTEWYIASKEPVLTYCPVGHRLPEKGVEPEWGTEYIHLADRRTCFFIPPKCPSHRQQAMDMRLASIDASETGMTRSKKFVIKASRPVVGVMAFYILALPDALLLTEWSREGH
jgi:hypothetical protein